MIIDGASVSAVDADGTGSTSASSPADGDQAHGESIGQIKMKKWSSTYPWLVQVPGKLDEVTEKSVTKMWFACEVCRAFKRRGGQCKGPQQYIDGAYMELTLAKVKRHSQCDVHQAAEASVARLVDTAGQSVSTSSSSPSATALDKCTPKHPYWVDVDPDTTSSSTCVDRTKSVMRCRVCKDAKDSGLDWKKAGGWKLIDYAPVVHTPSSFDRHAQSMQHLCAIDHLRRIKNAAPVTATELEEDMT